MITVVESGPYCTIQDQGRIGYGAWGISPGGAADRGSLELANRLVGNTASAAGFELTLGGARLMFSRPALIAVTGAACPFRVGNRTGVLDGPQPVSAGDEIDVGSPVRGLRTYVAVRGGVDSPLVLGSRSTDPSSGLGRTLRAGDRLPVGTQILGPPQVDVAPVAAWPNPFELIAVPGPRYDWFAPEAIQQLTGGSYTVASNSNRIGVRLEGAAITPRITQQMWSEPAVRGAIEVPPDGQPIVFMADHPTTCGYPVIAVLEPASADLAAQMRPGDRAVIRLSHKALRVYRERST